MCHQTFVLDNWLNTRFLEVWFCSCRSYIVCQVTCGDDNLARAHPISAVSRRHYPLGGDDGATAEDNVRIATFAKGRLMRNGAYLKSGIDILLETT